MEFRLVKDVGEMEKIIIRSQTLVEAKDYRKYF